MEFSIMFDAYQVRMVHCIYWGGTGYNFLDIIFLSLKINFVLANSAEPDEMLFVKVPVKGFLVFKGFKGLLFV